MVKGELMVRLRVLFYVSGCSLLLRSWMWLQLHQGCVHVQGVRDLRQRRTRVPASLMYLIGSLLMFSTSVSHFHIARVCFPTGMLLHRHCDEFVGLKCDVPTGEVENVPSLGHHFPAFLSDDMRLFDQT